MTEKLNKNTNGQWKLEKTGKRPGDWFYSSNDPRRKFIERKRAEEAEAKRQEKAEVEEKARQANLTNPFTGQIDSFSEDKGEHLKDASSWKQHIVDISQNPIDKKAKKPDEVVQVSPKIEFQQRKANWDAAAASAEANAKAASDKHMSDILSGVKPPVTMWEKAALASHMKRQQEALNKPESSKSKPSGLIVRRKEKMEKADLEMDMSNIIELLHHIKELKANLKEGDELPDWVSAKLTLATDYLSRIAHYVDGKKEMDSPLNKSKIDQLEKALLELKKEQPYWADKRPVNQIARDNQKNLQTFRDTKLCVGQARGGGLEVGSDPKLSGIPKEYEVGKTRSGKPVMSLPEHKAHSNFTEADHGDAYVYHKRLRDELKQDPTVNQKLVQHHQDAAAFHSKMQAQLRTSR